MCAPSLSSPTLGAALSSPGGCFESGHITHVTLRHRALGQKGDILQTCGLPRRVAGWGQLAVCARLQCQQKSSFPEPLGRDGTSSLSGLIAHVRRIYRSNCLCRARQTNRLLFCQAPFVIAGGWESFHVGMGGLVCTAGTSPAPAWMALAGC